MEGKEGAEKLWFEFFIFAVLAKIKLKVSRDGTLEFIMKILQEMEGVDFEWFATDKFGNLAVFITAGEGDIPENVLENIEMHSSISEKIELQNWGNTNIWLDYASLGLFAFDWCGNRGIYVKKASPNASAKFMVSIKSINQFPEIEIEFNEALEVKVNT